MTNRSTPLGLLLSEYFSEFYLVTILYIILYKIVGIYVDIFKKNIIFSVNNKHTTVKSYRCPVDIINKKLPFGNK